MNEQRGLEGLLAWQKSVDLVKRVYRDLLPLLPKEEKWAMATQLRRSSASIPANIAEGYGRFYYQEGVRFCYIARGSLDELITYITLAKELGYISKEVFESLRSDFFELQRIISGYIDYLKKSRRGEKTPGSSLGVSETQEIYSVYEELDDSEA
jgi:four helix bundle protein